MTRGRDLLPWLLFLFVFASKARAMVIPRLAPSGVIPVAKINTGSPTWQTDRFAALAAAGITGDVARAIVAHWAFEVGWGAGEWNFNVGNRIALPGDYGVDLGVQWSKAYPTLAPAVADYLNLLQARYPAAWSMLQNAPRSSAWARQLAASGYAELAPDEYERRYARVLARMGG